MASNWWEGNNFRIPGLPVRPTYAAALTPSSSSAQANPAADVLQQLGFRVDPAGLGSGEGMGGLSSGQQETREAKSVPDLLASMAQGVGMMSGPLGLATGVYGASQRTADKQMNPNFNWGDVAKAVVPGGGLFDLFSESSSGSSLPGGGPQFGAYSGERSFAEPDLSSFDPVAPDIYGGEQGPAPFSKGGTVKAKHLAGPNPPGPDDGLAYLDVGEEIIPKNAARKLKKTHGAGLFDVVRQGRLPAKR